MMAQHKTEGSSCWAIVGRSVGMNGANLPMSLSGEVFALQSMGMNFYTELQTRPTMPFLGPLVMCDILCFIALDASLGRRFMKLNFARNPSNSACRCQAFAANPA